MVRVPALTSKTTAGAGPRGRPLTHLRASARNDRASPRLIRITGSPSFLWVGSVHSPAGLDQLLGGVEHFLRQGEQLVEGGRQVEQVADQHGHGVPGPAARAEGVEEYPQLL